MQRNYLIYVNETGARGLKPTGNGPFVGIWWAAGPTIAALLQTASSVSASLGLIDSDFEHWREWPYVCQHFHKTKGDEYFSVPRGRVLVRCKTGRGLIYYGDATSMATLKRIAKLFRLSTWSAQLDEHYMTDADGYSDE